jgi:hypothetical protein
MNERPGHHRGDRAVLLSLLVPNAYFFVMGYVLFEQL